MDRNGYHHDYRRAKISKRQRATQDSSGGSSLEPEIVDDDGDEDYESDEDDEEDEEDDDVDECWPEKAMHLEDYYEYPFDAGEHTLCKCCL